MNIFNGFTKGINLGGWLSQNTLTSEHLNTFIQESDIAYIKRLNVDHIRVPMDYSIIENEKGEEIKEGYSYIDNCIIWCKKYNLNMILDLHKAPGYIFDDFENCNDFFTNKNIQDRFTNLWIKLAKRYGKYHDMLAFELLNEVVDCAYKDVWNDIVERTIKAIREYAPTSWILVGGTRFNSIVSIKELRKPYDNKIVFNFHCYEPLIFTHQGAYWINGMPRDFRITYPKTLKEYDDLSHQHLPIQNRGVLDGKGEIMCSKDFFLEFFKEAIEVSRKYDVPLYCGEYGVIDLADPEGTLNWYKDIHSAFETYNIGRAMWSYKKMDFGLIDDHYSSIREELIDNL